MDKPNIGEIFTEIYDEIYSSDVIDLTLNIEYNKLVQKLQEQQTCELYYYYLYNSHIADSNADSKADSKADSNADSTADSNADSNTHSKYYIYIDEEKYNIQFDTINQSQYQYIGIVESIIKLKELTEHDTQFNLMFYISNKAIFDSLIQTNPKFIINFIKNQCKKQNLEYNFTLEFEFLQRFKYIYVLQKLYNEVINIDELLFV